MERAADTQPPPGTKVNCSADKQLLQLRVLGFRFLQDGDVGVGVFPEREEVLVWTLRFRGVARHRVGATDLQMHQ